MTVVGRQYVFAQTAGKLPLKIPTSSRRHVHRTGAIGHERSLARPRARTIECRLRSWQRTTQLSSVSRGLAELARAKSSCRRVARVRLGQRSTYHAFSPCFHAV